MLDTIYKDAEKKLEDRISFLKSEFSKLRVGQATPSLVEDLPVPAYGTTMTVKELGAIAAPQPTLLTISIWDDSVVEAVAKAIMQSDLGSNPVVDGKTVKVPVPTLTEERREAMIKELGEKTESVRVDIRQIRQEKMKSIDDLKEEKSLSEDEHELAKKHIQKLIDGANEKVEELKESKITSLKSS
ncbi:ribosome recycling factor [candidate division WWE3 bacterium]|uniref:Ribosome recycling factor n=1 Tax=candidate division WWE3 bacterium TaxID=2053526 RepID=A0A955LG34_UNCKA|nr:ribosome recycling factor [candidate division WWE3 bacterium]